MLFGEQGDDFDIDESDTGDKVGWKDIDAAVQHAAITYIDFPQAGFVQAPIAIYDLGGGRTVNPPPPTHDSSEAP